MRSRAILGFISFGERIFPSTLSILIALLFIFGREAIIYSKEITTDYYRVEVDERGDFKIFSLTGQELLPSFPLFFADYKSGKIGGEIDKIAVQQHRDKMNIVGQKELDEVYITITLTLHPHEPYIDVDIALNYKERLDVNYEWLEFPLSTSQAKILRRDQRYETLDNNKVYINDKWTPKVIIFNSEWGENPSLNPFYINEEAIVFFGRDNTQAMKVYPSPPYTIVRFVLDDVVTHPHYYYFIYNDYNSRIDLSSTYRPQYSSANYHISFAIGREERILRKERQPLGYEATLIFSEHAEGQDVDTGEAIAYGSSDRNSPDYGKKGIVGHGLTFTRSIWAESSSAYNSTMGLDNPKFRELTDRMYRDGVEIIPHTITNLSDNRKKVIEGLRKFEAYSSDNWIDHAGARNYEDLVNSGWKRHSPYYILDLLDKFDYNLAWSYIDLNENYKPPREEEHWSVPLGEINMLVPDRTDQIQPILFYNNRLDDDISDDKKIYLWTTISFWRGITLSDYYSPFQIDKLISERGLNISHHYFAGQKIHSWFIDYLVKRSDGGWDISPTFDNYLSYMADKEREGRLWVPTLSQWANYLLATDEVDIIPTLDEEFIIRNEGDKNILGFALSTELQGINAIYLDGTILNDFKRVGDDLIFWFDLSAKEERRIFFESVSEYPNTHIIDFTQNDEEVKISWMGVDNKGRIFPLTPSILNKAHSQLEYSFKLNDELWSSYSSQTSIIYKQLEKGEYTFYVRARNGEGKVDPIPATLKFEIDYEEQEQPFGVMKLMNLPNPFSDEVMIYYNLSGDADRVTTTVYSIAGELIFQDETPTSSGDNYYYWDGRDETGEDIANGIYICVLEASKDEEKIRMVSKMAKIK